MRKYIIGAIAGLMLSFAVGAHAEVISLINKTVDGMFPVTVDGKSVGDAIVVDNKTYLPVRDFGEATGYTVTFTDAREVVMTKNAIAQPETTTSPLTTTPTSGYTPEKGERLRELQKILRDIETQADELYKPVADYNTERATNPDLQENEEVKQARIAWEAKKAELLAVQSEIEQLRIDLGL